MPVIATIERSPLQRATVTANGQTLNYLRTGGNKPPLVLLHGFTDAAVVWETLIPHLAETHDVIAYDARGHGKSSRLTAEPFTLGDLAHDCAGLIDVLALKDVVLAGHSMGAATAFLVGAWYPEKLSRIVLEDPPFYFTRVPVEMSAWKEGLVTLQASPRESILTYYRSEYVGWDEADIQPRVDARLDLDVSIFDVMEWNTPPYWRDELPKLHIKGLLMTGNTQNGALVSKEVSDHLAQYWHELQVFHSPDATHHVRCTHFTDYLNTLRAFLRD